MLAPQDRRVLHEAIRPPPGYDMDALVGTTYGLDLAGLLSIPLAFVSESTDTDDPREADPVELLRAVREAADDIAFFCQEGRIKAPTEASDLYAYLEDSVYEATAPNGGEFHPKLWVARYTSEDERPRYRVLCMSRNLTFDRSWDTLLTLEGDLTDRQYAFADQHPLGDFVEALPDLAVDEVPPGLADTIADISHEIRRVRFDYPNHVEDIDFWPLGVAKDSWPFPDSYSDILIVSPFTRPPLLKKLQEESRSASLVSRLEELDATPPEALEPWEGVYALHPDADFQGDQDLSDDQSESPPASVGGGLSGLHAKLFVLDQGWDTSLYVGSANATTAAFERNVEFLVELQGKKSKLGTEVLLEDQDDQDEEASKKTRRFQDLLVPYEADEEEWEEPEDDPLESALDEAWSTIIETEPAATVERNDDGYDVHLRLNDAVDLPPGVEASCWPITSQGALRKPVRTDDPEVTFSGLAKNSLTRFFAFSLTAESADEERTRTFVLKLSIDGLPEDRDDAVLQAMLSSPDRLLRLLALILGEETLGNADAIRSIAGTGGSSRSMSAALDGIPLVELLVQSLEENPEKIDRVVRLVRDLREASKGPSDLPKDLVSILETVETARRRINDG